jgi:glycine C-acetyltransferase
MNSDVPRIDELHRICREFKVNLVVDIAHNLGAIGPTGQGHLELQNMVGKPDIVVGSFSKTFASNGGFVASNSRSLKLAGLCVGPSWSGFNRR